ncbi:protein kinase domain-containing protein [Chroococcidiopsis thermalis]|uniref:Serine/threonine protein kinase with WD40 repeats n=1 Tax=Chroococcidiopsis thermalis (strain PCC 7203) TaxID=251229 RepID=K9TZV1_CHRTP|nr:4-Cys prefix domain-containing protein [Chroococcidiopsis thermalis]AFY88115.1 serine/threonine protein kinase with WD40 repeats [Chroococcidiopsis thermalis PCC 7203]PSB49665.1 serine/threonine protein kinase [Cyanosarcina cf. burmensis CCALA 770]
MLCCLNPNCQNPVNPDDREYCFSCGTKLVPSLGDRFRPVYPLAGGGFSQIFLAQDRDARESYVVQQLALPGSNKYYSVSNIFYSLAKKLAQIGENDRISTLSAYFTQGNYFYLVQPAIAGQTLRQELVQQGTFSEQQIWDVLGQILPLLYFIHKRQIVHGNINLESIIRRNSDDRLMLINFDLTKQLFHPNNLHPNNSFDDDWALQTNLDFYDLSVACLHLLSGHPYFSWLQGDRNWSANWQRHPLLQAVSQELAQAIDRLLQKKPQQNYLAVARSLQPIVPALTTPLTAVETAALVSPQANTSATSPQPTVITPSAKPSKRSRLLGGCFLLLLALVAYLYYWQQQQVNTITGHTDEVNSVAFTPDGKKFATGSDDRTVKIWDANSWREIRSLEEHLDWVYSVAIGNDNQTLVSGSKDNTVKVWNLNTGREIKTLRGHKSYVNSVAISPNGQKIASASYDKTAKIWDLKTGKNITLTGHTAEVLTVAISPNGQKLVTGSGDKTMKIWDLNHNPVKELRTLRGHKGAVWSVAISPDSQKLYSVSDGTTIAVWNLNTGRAIRTIAGHTADINLVAVSPDGQTIATCSDDRTIKLWNVISGAELATFKGHTAAVWAVAFSPDGRTLVSTSEDKTVKVWRVPQ